MPAMDDVASFDLDRHERALRAVVRLRPVLDDLEARLVFECRRDGLTWAEIGEILGVRRETAMRRHPHATWRALRRPLRR
jgi:DNA-directed RNA polymerase specialized sigma24 family protein